MDIPQQLISPDSLTTFGGISVAVVAITNSLKNALGSNPPWVAWILAMVICVLGAVFNKPKPDAIGYVIALVNGCIVYCSAFGMNSLGAATSTKVGTFAGAAPGMSGKGTRVGRPFFENWL
jgi:hypothetical protein